MFITEYFMPKLYLSVGCVQRSTALPAQLIITDMNIKAQPLPALHVKKAFVFMSKLQQHRRVHIKQKHYCCFYGGCTKCYKHLQDLNRHTASHLSEKLECPLCDYSGNQKRLLKCHSTVHQNTPQFCMMFSIFLKWVKMENNI